MHQTILELVTYFEETAPLCHEETLPMQTAARGSHYDFASATPQR